MKHYRVPIISAFALAAASCAAFAASGPTVIHGNQLPDLHCTTTRCTFVQPQTPHRGIYSRAMQPMAAPLAAPLTDPVVIAPPAGQRLLYQGAQYPDCQDISAVSSSNPYEYIKGTSIMVPLGTTHTSLLATFQSNLSGGPAGAGADVAMLQVKRSSGSTWFMAAASYAYTMYGSTSPQNLFNTATYQALVDLASLPDGTGVPSEIDVRLIVFPLYTNGFTNVVENSVCWGQLQLTF
ncbi:MAG TPA: hypothetical protein VFK31_06225 [Rhodanobacteraceae bacterium]|nr:hypothetical protein [Rhodanobacteraceae bacterium]